jgi:hypothetical protein
MLGDPVDIAPVVDEVVAGLRGKRPRHGDARQDGDEEDRQLGDSPPSEIEDATERRGRPRESDRHEASPPIAPNVPVPPHGDKAGEPIVSWAGRSVWRSRAG